MSCFSLSSLFEIKIEIVGEDDECYLLVTGKWHKCCMSLAANECIFSYNETNSLLHNRLNNWRSFVTGSSFRFSLSHVLHALLMNSITVVPQQSCCQLHAHKTQSHFHMHRIWILILWVCGDVPNYCVNCLQNDVLTKAIGGTVQSRHLTWSALASYTNKSS